MIVLFFNVYNMDLPISNESPKKYNASLAVGLVGVVLVAVGVFYFFNYSKKLKNQIITEEVVNNNSAIKEYSYKDVIYNFWGPVQEKQGEAVLVEATSPDPAKASSDWPRQIIKFEITDQTKIVKTDEQGNQVFVKSETIQIGDHLGIKTDQIDTIREEATTTDILILPQMPQK